EGDVLRLRGRRELPEYIAQRHAQPWDHHRPAFHAAQAVDALGRRDAVQQVVERQRAGALAFARDLDVPGRGAQGLRRPRRIRLAGAELVEVVVAGDVLVAGERLVGGEAGARLRGRDADAGGRWRLGIGAAG